MRNRLRRSRKSAKVYPRRTDSDGPQTPLGGQLSCRHEEVILTGTDTTAVGTAKDQDGATRDTGRPVIEIDHVTKRFEDYLAVADADFTIESGEFFSMLGPSGCGKTTTLRMIAGFETPTEGAIRLEGRRRVPGTPP